MPPEHLQLQRKRNVYRLLCCSLLVLLLGIGTPISIRDCSTIRSFKGRNGSVETSKSIAELVVAAMAVVSEKINILRYGYFAAAKTCVAVCTFGGVY
ncbi:hypothetical protein Golomagni_06233 [Golovinomyces magnicellulatus]|nr:hypothetical protein Golomagni_06233 [Golovinomyces magnicellulatus]